MYSTREDVLRPISEDELQDLLHLYENTTSFHYFSIYTQIKWNIQLEEVPDRDSPKWNRFKRQFYTHRKGNLRVNGTFVSILRESVISVSFHTFEPSMKELRECLERTQLIDWNAGPLIEGNHIDLAPFITEILCKRGAIIEHDRLSLYFLLNKQNVNDFPKARIPDGYEIKPLMENDADKIHSIWANKSEASVEFIRGLIELNKGLGIFSAGGQLAAWIIQNEFAGLGVLQTVPEEQGRGFATILAAEMCRQIAEIDGLNVTAFTTSKNLKSQNVLKRLGFEVVEYSKWTKYREIVN